MSKSKSVWESRFYCLKHRLKMHIDFACQDLATESIEAEGKETNTRSHWEVVSRYRHLKNLIKEADYIETQTYF